MRIEDRILHINIGINATYVIDKVISLEIVVTKIEIKEILDVQFN